MGDISIRKFKIEDIKKKVKWVNDDNNNKYLHYNLPINCENTLNWFLKIKDSNKRFDATILYKGEAIGVIGLLNIENGQAEYYILIGEQKYKGKGIASEATRQLIEYCKKELKLDKVILYTEVDNILAQRLFEKIGFKKIRIEKNSVKNRGKLVDRFYYEYII